jgi:hypothetical protein
MNRYIRYEAAGDVCVGQCASDERADYPFTGCTRGPPILSLKYHMLRLNVDASESTSSSSH